MAKGAAGLAAGAAGGGLLFAGAVGYAGGLQVPAMQVMVLAVLAFTGSLALLKVKDFVCQGVEAWQALNDTIQGGMQALTVLKDTVQYMQLELRTARIEAVEKMKGIDEMDARYDRMDKCGNKLEVMQSF